MCLPSQAAVAGVNLPLGALLKEGRRDTLHFKSCVSKTHLSTLHLGSFKASGLSANQRATWEDRKASICI